MPNRGFVGCGAFWHNLVSSRCDRNARLLVYTGKNMPFPIKICVLCGEEFELKPDKPGFANRCPSCSEPEEAEPPAAGDTTQFRNDAEANAERRRVIRDLLYPRDS
jgi:hypothetical protein